jgi:hypothetical protein
LKVGDHHGSGAVQNARESPHRSSKKTGHDHADPRSEFQRALRSLHVAHLVAPTPQAKGKIERTFQTFQNRLVTLLAHAEVNDWKSADLILQMEIQRQGRKTQRTTGRIPSEVWKEQILKRSARLSPAPASSLLDLHLSHALSATEQNQIFCRSKTRQIST